MFLLHDSKLRPSHVILSFDEKVRLSEIVHPIAIELKAIFLLCLCLRVNGFRRNRKTKDPWMSPGDIDSTFNIEILNILKG